MRASTRGGGWPKLGGVLSAALPPAVDLRYGNSFTRLCCSMSFGESVRKGAVTTAMPSSKAKAHA